MRWCLTILGVAAVLAACAVSAHAQGRRGAGAGFGNSAAKSNRSSASPSTATETPSRGHGSRSATAGNAERNTNADPQRQTRRRNGTYPRPEARETDGPASATPARPGRRGRGWAAYLDRHIERDLQWLREHGLDEYADRVVAERDGPSPARHVLLWQIHRRIQGLRRLGGKDAERAIEQIKLEFATARLARRFREASGQEKADLARQLRQSIGRLFDLRLEVQRAMTAAVRRRLKAIQEQLDKHEQLRDELIEQRFTQLTDSQVPLPDPVLESLPQASANGVADKPDPRPQEPRLGPGDRLEPRGPVERGNQRVPERLDGLFENDIKWLRANGLHDFADRIVEIRDSDASARRLVLWRIHRRIEQWRRLRGKDMKRAIDGARLTFEVARLASRYREAPEDQRDALAAELRDALGRQFDARHAAQQAIMESIQQRLEGARKGVHRQRELREKLVTRRFKELTDPSKPVPDPELVPRPQLGPGRSRRPPRP